MPQAQQASILQFVPFILIFVIFYFLLIRPQKTKEKDHIKMIWPEYANFRSQDLPEAYHDAGQFYWANTNKFMKGKALFAKDSLSVILPRYLVQDIDTSEDWETAEIMFATMKAKTESKNK